MKVEIYRPEFNTFYPSQILDFSKESRIIISGPIKQSNPVFIHINEKVNILYYVENRGRYTFTARVVSREFSPIYSLTLGEISNTKIIQLREFFRLPVTLEVEKKIKLNNDKKKDSMTELCEIKDLSGGGIRVYCRHKHKIGDIVVCKFNLLDRSIVAKCNVVRVQEIDSFNFKYSIGLSFVDIEEIDRDIIIKYIFTQQRILRGKGLI